MSHPPEIYAPYIYTLNLIQIISEGGIYPDIPPPGYAHECINKAKKTLPKPSSGNSVNQLPPNTVNTKQNYGKRLIKRTY
jgi:hypothetical protein